MNLEIILPFSVFTHVPNVAHVVVETRNGSFSLLPHLVSCAKVLVPGILTYRTESCGDEYVTVDEGIITKTGPNVLVSVRRAFAGIDSKFLNGEEEEDFQALDGTPAASHSLLDRLEAGFLRRFLTPRLSPWPSPVRAEPPFFSDSRR